MASFFRRKINYYAEKFTPSLLKKFIAK